MKLLILDGNSIVNRAFYGVRALTTRDGLYTNGIYGFLNILQKLQDEEQPEGLCVAFDLKAPTFRHEKYALYKANRQGMPEELAMQMPVLKEVLAAMSIPMYSLEGWEADDLIGTISRRCGECGWQCVVATGDRDSLQLVSDHTSVRLAVTKAGQTRWERYTPESFAGEYGFTPPYLVDLKALMGDSSDNIPGVAGVGPKTATELLCTYGSLEGVYSAADQGVLRPTVEKKLVASRDMAFLSYDLATIRKNAPIPFSPEDALCKPWNKEALYRLFLRLEFIQMIDRYHLRESEQTTSSEIHFETVCLDTPENAEASLDELSTLPWVAVWLQPDLKAFSAGDGKVCRVYTEARLGERYSSLLRRFLGGEIRKVVHDAKPLYRLLLQEKLPCEGVVFDTAVAAYLLDATQGKYELERVSVSYLNTEPGEAWSDRAGILARLYPILSQKLEEQGLKALYEQVEFPLCRVLAEMEHRGVLVDRDALVAFGTMLSQRISQCSDLIFSYAGESFNINSTKQLGVLLFEKLGLPPVKKTKSGYSTGAEVLEKLRDKHPVVPAILDYRMLTKLNSTYAEGLIKMIGEDGRIHTTFQNTVTATGRLSSTDPNLQNIPIRTELGSEIRKMFIPEPGCVFVDADYSQIELRVLAHISEDRAMQEAFLSGVDFHTATAAQVFGVPVEQVTPQLRRNAKAVNFGIVYGISEFSLSEDIGVSRWEAREYIQAYLARFRGVSEYMHNVVEEARSRGYTCTLFGRRRYIPELTSSNHMVKMAAERIALNSPIQGTAADIMKIATVHTTEALRSEGLHGSIVLQVHDELIVECPMAEAEKTSEIVSREMTRAADLAVPLLVEAKIGASWLEAK